MYKTALYFTFRKLCSLILYLRSTHWSSGICTDAFKVHPLVRWWLLAITLLKIKTKQSDDREMCRKLWHLVHPNESELKSVDMNLAVPNVNCYWLCGLGKTWEV